MRRLLWVMLAAATAACSGSASTTGACTADSECAAPGTRCDVAAKRCVCKTDEACDAKEFCNSQGVCQARAGCSSNAECAEGSFCDIQSGQCLTAPAQQLSSACGLASHCAFGAVCSSGKCAAGCFDDGDCTLGEVCFDGVCNGSAGLCSSDGFCELGDRCVNQSCTADTSVNCDACDPQMQDSCGPGNYCLINPRHDPADPTTGAANYCGTECDSAEDCGNGYSCTRIVLVSGSQPLCTNDTECQAPRVCRRSGENDPRGFCTCDADADCALDIIRACQGTCGGLGLLPCTDNAECPSRNCVKRCLGSNVMCTDSADCPPQSLCAPGGFGGMACLNTGMPCQSGADCLCNAGRCFGSGRPCTNAAQCQLTCQDGGCVLGAGCGPIEGLTCEDLR